MKPNLVREFARESNKIEGITSKRMLDLHEEALSEFLPLYEITIPDLQKFVTKIAGAELRDRRGMDVFVGDHRPPRGGPKILEDLDWRILREANAGSLHPFEVHQRYETLHPFTDGNGRSGRALWAWQMLKENRWPGLRLGFLHAFYYQSLDGAR